MRMTTLATVVSFVLLGAAVARADSTITQEKFSAADKNSDGSITLAEAQAGMPALAAKFTSVDSNQDGKVSADELNAYDKSPDKSMEVDQATTTPVDK